MPILQSTITVRPGKSTRASAKKPERSQLTPDDWIRGATELLIHRSIDAVRVDVLAKEIGVSRGSFYWHFTDRQDLLLRVLLAWKDAQTEQLISQYRNRGMKAKALIIALVELPFHGRSARKGSSVELAIRAWARRDETARRVVDEVDAKRLQYIEECFLGLEFTKAEARSRAFLLYCYMQSESLFHNQGTTQEKVARREFVAQLLMRR